LASEVLPLVNGGIGLIEDHELLVLSQVFAGYALKCLPLPSPFSAGLRKILISLGQPSGWFHLKGICRASKTWGALLKGLSTEES
jgi:hypothetical protein